MGLRYSRRIRLGSGVTLNLGKRSASVSIGGRHERVTVGTRGTHASVGIPGTGISYRTGSKRRGGSWVWSAITFVFFLIWLMLHTLNQL
jgi:hypothetical protein